MKPAWTDILVAKQPMRTRETLCAVRNSSMLLTLKGKRRERDGVIILADQVINSEMAVGFSESASSSSWFKLHSLLRQCSTVHAEYCIELLLVSGSICKGRIRSTENLFKIWPTTSVKISSLEKGTPIYRLRVTAAVHETVADGYMRERRVRNNPVSYSSSLLRVF